MDSGTGDLVQPGNRGLLSREESVTRIEDEVFDTTSSPSKPRSSSKLKGIGDNTFAGKNFAKGKKEEVERRAREVVFDVGLIEPEGGGGGC